MELSQRLLEVRSRIAEAAVRSGRNPGEITLLAVTKTFPPEDVRAAYDLGLREFGENRVQEALPKIEALPSDARWHLIGQLQTNKINRMAGKFVLVQSVDSLRLAESLSARLSGGTQDVLLEVNTSGEESKSGVPPSKALEEAERIVSIRGLSLKGLMTVGPLTDDAAKIRESFRRLRGIFDEARAKPWSGPAFTILSMGMSGDYESAIEEGSTLVRIGSALFGRRG